MTSPPWSVRRLLAWMAEFFGSKGIRKPRVDAEWLLAHVLGVERLALYMDVEREPDAPQLTALRELVKRRGRREPLQYLTGHCAFHGVELQIGPGAFIPRPETEILVQRALARLEENEKTKKDGPARPLIVDIGAGCGCIACALAVARPNAAVQATDNSAAALQWAQTNIESLGLDGRVTLHEGDLAAPLDQVIEAATVDLLVSNPPYVARHERDDLPPEVHFDPPEALFAGPDGTDLYPRLVDAGKGLLKPGGWLLVEIGATQADAVRGIIASAGGFGQITLTQDLAGLDRVLEARRV